jgi:hypothetical protein
VKARTHELVVVGQIAEEVAAVRGEEARLAIAQAGVVGAIEERRLDGDEIAPRVAALGEPVGVDEARRDVVEVARDRGGELGVVMGTGRFALEAAEDRGEARGDGGAVEVELDHLGALEEPVAEIECAVAKLVEAGLEEEQQRARDRRSAATGGELELALFDHREQDLFEGGVQLLGLAHFCLAPHRG